MIYRRRKKSDCWHFEETCHQWPAKGDYVERDCVGTPSSGELCNTCIAKRRKRQRDSK